MVEDQDIASARRDWQHEGAAMTDPRVACLALSSHARQRQSASREDDDAPPVDLLHAPSPTKGVICFDRAEGALFDFHNRPTRRLRQLLHALAWFVLDSCAPPRSVVITPETMQTYYHRHRETYEPFPWRRVFDHHLSALSDLYASIDVEHDGTQVRPQKRHVIPNMTLAGFEAWSTMTILAYPDVECRRLAQILHRHTLTTGDEPVERFSSDLRREHFPAAPALAVRDHLHASLVKHCRLPQHPAHSTILLDEMCRS